MIPTRIFLDLDDVCNTFTPYALNYVGCPIGSTDYSAYDPKYGWNIVAAANELNSIRNFTLSSFWNCFNKETWANVPPSNELKLLLRNCMALVGKKNVCILSAPVDSPGCLEGKLDWIRKYLPEWLHQQFLIGSLKHFCARPDALLIDDADHNVDKFMEYGGQAITVPRPWNRLHNLDTMEHLLNAFQRLLERKRNYRSVVASDRGGAFL